MSISILDLIKEKKVLLDGGMGTELIKQGLASGECPETWNIEKPEAVQRVHESYFNAGSVAVLTNSFGGSQIKLSSHGQAEKCYELNLAAAEAALAVRPGGKYVGGSIGPTGQFLQPYGQYTEKEFEDSYAEQVKGLSDGRVDFLLIETQYDIQEALCALRAARRVSNTPVFLTMTFNSTPKGFFTIMGNSVEKYVKEMEAQEVSVIGANCTIDSSDMGILVKQIRGLTSLPILAQANAGQPVIDDKGQTAYTQDLEDYVRYIPEIVKNGADLIGGCCGTDPGYIERMAEVLKNL